MLATCDAITREGNCLCWRFSGLRQCVIGLRRRELHGYVLEAAQEADILDVS